MAVVTPLNNPGGPEGDTVTVPYPLLSPKSYFCHMSSVRGTSDGGGPVTRNRVPDREEQGKPRKDLVLGTWYLVVMYRGNGTPDVAVVIPLNNPLGPADDTVTAE